MEEKLNNSEQPSDWWYELTPGQQEQINEGLADIEAGRVMSSEEFWKRLKES